MLAAALRILSRRVWKAFNRWCNLLAGARRLRVVGAVVSRWHSTNPSRAFESWRDNVQYKKLLRRSAKKVVQRWRRLSSYSAMLKWKAEVLEVTDRSRMYAFATNFILQY